MKKRLSILLTAILVLSMTLSSVSAFAADAPVADSVYAGDYTLQDKYLEKYSDDKENGVKQYDVYNADAFWSLVSLISTTADGFEGCTISLKCDLVYNTGKASDWASTKPSVLWNTIGNDTVPFKGTFDGEGHTISGIYVEGKNIGLFGRVAGATIKNVGLINSYIKETTSGGYQGSIVSTMYTAGSTVSGCYSDAIIYSTSYGSGGIVGLVNTADCKISECAFAGSISGSKDSSTAGGILGVANAGKDNAACSVSIEDCVNLGTIDAGKQRGAGIVAQAYDNVAIKRCFGIGAVTSAKTVSDTDTRKVYDGCAMFGSIAAGKVGAIGVTVEGSYMFSDLAQRAYGIDQDKTAKYSDSFASGLTSLVSTAIKGDAAKTALTSLDFTKTWTAVADSFPVPTAVKTIIDGVDNLADPADKKEPDEDTGAADTSEPENKDTEPTTTAPDTEAKTEAPTEAVTEPTESGCGSLITGTGITLVIASIGACIVAGKKRK